MLAALSIADPQLADRMIEATFSDLPQAASRPDSANRKPTPREMERIIGLHIKKKTVETVQACKDMLLQEPVERFESFWTTVRLFEYLNIPYDQARSLTLTVFSRE